MSAVPAGQAALAVPTTHAVDAPTGQDPSLVSAGQAPSLVPAGHAAPLVHDGQAVAAPAGQALATQAAQVLATLATQGLTGDWRGPAQGFAALAT
jgi:hypothetical protein